MKHGPPALQGPGCFLCRRVGISVVTGGKRRKIMNTGRIKPQGKIDLVIADRPWLGTVIPPIDTIQNTNERALSQSVLVVDCWAKPVVNMQRRCFMVNDLICRSCLMRISRGIISTTSERLVSSNIWTLRSRPMTSFSANYFTVDRLGVSNILRSAHPIGNPIKSSRSDTPLWSLI